MSMWRHTKTTSDHIEDLTIKARDIGASEITYDKAKTLLQTGTGTPPYTATYKSFTTAYGTPPIVSLEPIGPVAAPQRIGSVGLRATVTRVAKGSFTWSGTPAGRWAYKSLGFLA